jgi:hypothetical protein
MLREYLSNIADKFRTHLDTTESINAQDFVDKIDEVYDKGLLEGLAQAIAEGRKTEYVQEYFTGSKQYLTYSIDFEPKLIFFQSGESNTTVLENKPDIDVATLNIPNLMVKSAEDFVEGQEYPFIGATVWRYKKAEDTLAYASSNSSYINYTFNQTTGKWDITLGRADSSTTATRFVSSGQVPSQILFVGKAEPSVLEGTTTITETSKILTIDGLPKAPKEFHIHAYIPSLPTNDNHYFIRGLDYYKDGFIANNRKRLAVSYYTVTENVSNMYAANGSVSEITQNSYNVFSFENGTFKIDFSYSDLNCFGANNSYKWTATF